MLFGLEKLLRIIWMGQWTLSLSFSVPYKGSGFHIPEHNICVEKTHLTRCNLNKFLIAIMSYKMRYIKWEIKEWRISVYNGDGLFQWSKYLHGQCLVSSVTIEMSCHFYRKFVKCVVFEVIIGAKMKCMRHD